MPFMLQMLILISTIVLALALGGCTAAPHDARTPTGFLYESIEVDGSTYPYSVFVPRDYATRTDWPVVLFLHGRGESGTDGSKQMAVGLGDPMIYAPQDYPFITVFPQKPDYDTQWEDHEPAVLAMLDRTLEAYAIDRTRVYLTGLSQGGNGTWTFGARYPERWAAIVPVCGYVDRPSRAADGSPIWVRAEDSPRTERFAEALRETPVWAFHGLRDDVVLPSETRVMIEAIRRVRGSGPNDPLARMTLYPEANHNSWDQAYREGGLVDWLLSHERR
ncbi:MAG: prolyl oligopeptidase family serine peptidase [Planctomycetota bacterium]